MPNIKPMSPAMEEKWIDLVCLSQIFQMCEDDKIVVIEDTSVNQEEVYLYNLRIALRSVNHKITKITYFWNRDGELDFIRYETTIRKNEYETAINLHKNFRSETCFERNELVSDSDTESESEDSTDPI